MSFLACPGIHLQAWKTWVLNQVQNDNLPSLREDKIKTGFLNSPFKSTLRQITAKKLYLTSISGRSKGTVLEPAFSVILSEAKDLLSIVWINFTWFNHQHCNL